MLYIGYLIIVDGQSIKKTSFGNSIAMHPPKRGLKLHKYGLKHALHILDGHFR